MRKLWVAILLAGCGADQGLVGGTWTNAGGLEPQSLTFTDARYTLLRPPPYQSPEVGAWTADAGKLQFTPDDEPAPPAMEFAVSGDHLRIWWPPRLLREYDRQ